MPSIDGRSSCGVATEILLAIAQYQSRIVNISRRIRISLEALGIGVHFQQGEIEVWRMKARYRYRLDQLDSGTGIGSARQTYHRVREDECGAACLRDVGITNKEG